MGVPRWTTVERVGAADPGPGAAHPAITQGAGQPAWGPFVLGLAAGLAAGCGLLGAVIWVPWAIFLLAPLSMMGIAWLLTFALRTDPAAPNRRAASVAPTWTSSFDVTAVLEALQGVRQRAAGRLPAPARIKLDHICHRILGVLPRLHQVPFPGRAAWVIQRTATTYLPETLEAYLALPSAYAATRVVQDGKTADELLAEQLDLLATSVDELAGTIRQTEAGRISSP